MLAIWWWVGDTGGMQGNSDQNLELLDAGGLVGHLVPEGSFESAITVSLASVVDERHLILLVA